MAFSRTLLQRLLFVKKAGATLISIRLNGTASTTTFEINGRNAFRLHKLEEGPSSSVTLTRDEALKYFKDMYTIRRMEQRANQLYRMRHIRGFLHFCNHQEATCVGMRAAMSDLDAVITSYRVHGWAYSMGVSLRGILSELTARETGCSGGKGGSMHMFGENLYGGQSIVGAQVPQGAGIALALKYNNIEGCCFTLYGDGAANQGQVHEAFNMAKLWDLPCVFVCENNKYGMGTHVNRSSASIDYYSRGDYIPGVWVDGSDVLAVRQASQFAREYCLSGMGPILLEIDTYRLETPSGNDPGRYLNMLPGAAKKYYEWKGDPIKMFREKIEEAELATEEELKEIETNVKKELRAVSEQAMSDPELDPADLYTDVYSEVPTGYKVRGVSLTES